MRIFAARGAGVWAARSFRRLFSADVLAPTGWPHEKQNLAEAGNSVPQLIQFRERIEPQFWQNFASEGLDVWQLGQSILGEDIYED
jgi:hypothetical protein